MITVRTVLECETKRLLKRVTNSVRQRVTGFTEDEANDLAVAQLWTIRQLLCPTDSAESAAERPDPATSLAGSGRPDVRSAPENSHSGDGADRISQSLPARLAAQVDRLRALGLHGETQTVVDELCGLLRETCIELGALTLVNEQLKTQLAIAQADSLEGLLTAIETMPAGNTDRPTSQLLRGLAAVLCQLQDGGPISQDVFDRIAGPLVQDAHARARMFDDIEATP